VSYIIAIETAVPEFVHTQHDCAAFYSNSTKDLDIKRKINIISSKTGIETRYSVLKDYSLSPSAFEFYPKNEELLPQPTLSQRMEVFREEALILSLHAIQKIKNIDRLKHSITDVITVTCTGLFAPGLDIQLVEALGLKPTVGRSSVNFMGCNAAIIAMKQADAICKGNPKANVLLVCTELCTLHFQKEYSDDYIVSNQLFADGCAAVLISAQPTKNEWGDTIEIKDFHSMLLHKGYSDMAWQLSDTGFKMNLTSYVSELINTNIKELLQSIELDVATIQNWAIHPGGKKILIEFCEALQIDIQKLNPSFDVLKNYGNMSSPTVLFVLKQIIENTTYKQTGETVFAAAFGPGISIETMQLQYA
jgi:alpha-pyrone synthase